MPQNPAVLVQCVGLVCCWCLLLRLSVHVLSACLLQQQKCVKLHMQTLLKPNAKAAWSSGMIPASGGASLFQLAEHPRSEREVPGG